MKKVLSYGEILWDVIDGQAKIGGAPFNLAGHLARLGAEAFLYSKVGADELGRRALKEIARLGVSSNYVKTDARYPTGTALVRLVTLRILNASRSLRIILSWKSFLGNNWIK